MSAAAPSPAGPAEAQDAIRYPPAIALARAAQILRFSQRQIECVFRARRARRRAGSCLVGVADD